jgi:hypothetical protein
MNQLIELYKINPEVSMVAVPTFDMEDNVEPPYIFKLVEEFTDDLFNDGWRFCSYVKYSSIDYPEFLASEQDELDKAFNEEPVEQVDRQQYYNIKRRVDAIETKLRSQHLRSLLGVFKIPSIWHKPKDVTLDHRLMGWSDDREQSQSSGESYWVEPIEIY